ncbi:MAG: polysulfide reductase NrfD [Robiginitalea sp.]
MRSYEQLIKDVGPQKFNLKGKLWVALLLAVIVAGIIAYIDQLIQGQVVTNMRDYVLWGFYISNFVFFVATSFVAAIAVAALRLTKSEWRRPFVRIAEVVALACIVMAGITIIIDMARPDRMLNLFVHARLQSPITENKTPARQDLRVLCNEMELDGYTSTITATIYSAVGFVDHPLGPDPGIY